MRLRLVVYLLFPTSNHNQVGRRHLLKALYIFCFLHQTTTARLTCKHVFSCISSVSYIKPQHELRSVLSQRVVYLLFPTSNHNVSESVPTVWFVVYLLFPTSNHNTPMGKVPLSKLYIFCFLHQTTTRLGLPKFAERLYIFCFLHQTTTTQALAIFTRKLYIFCFLHQTTTQLHDTTHHYRCISSVSYIKPQQRYENLAVLFCCISSVSYIKPQRQRLFHLLQVRCISSVSYIKPQLPRHDGQG